MTTADTLPDPSDPAKFDLARRIVDGLNASAHCHKITVDELISAIPSCIPILGACSDCGFNFGTRVVDFGGCGVVGIVDPGTDFLIPMVQWRSLPDGFSIVAKRYECDDKSFRSIHSEVLIKISDAVAVVLSGFGDDCSNVFERFLAINALAAGIDLATKKTYALAGALAAAAHHYQTQEIR